MATVSYAKVKNKGLEQGAWKGASSRYSSPRREEDTPLAGDVLEHWAWSQILATPGELNCTVARVSQNLKLRA